MTWNLFGGLIPQEVDTKGAAEKSKIKSRSNSGDSGTEEGFEHVLTFTEVTDIINKAIKDGDLDDIQSYENTFITDLSDENFKNFCLDQLNLKLEDQRIKNVEERQSKIRSDHQHIYSNILSKYKLDQELKCDYSVKELVLLAIAANDELAEKYQHVLFAEKNLSLLPLLVGGQKYIKIFIEKFPIFELYTSLKGKIIETQFGQVNFFAALALRKEQELLNTVLVEYVLKDLEKVLETSNSDKLYGMLETASLAKNEEFIKIVLNSIKRYIVNQDKKDLLKDSFITILDTAIGQEHVSIVQYLCAEGNDLAIQEIYQKALANSKVIKRFNEQILAKIKNGGDNGARKGKEEVYNLILKTASQTGNIEFITKVLDLIENDPQLSNDQDKQAFLQDSLITILESASVIESLTANVGEGPKSLVADPVGNSSEDEGVSFIEVLPQECGSPESREKELPVQSTLAQAQGVLNFVVTLGTELVKVGVAELGEYVEAGRRAVNTRPIREEGQEDKVISRTEDGGVVIPESLTFAEIVDALNKAKNKNNYEELDQIVGVAQQNNDDVLISDLSSENFKKFCLEQLHLRPQGKKSHTHVYHNILSQYKLDTGSSNCHYSAKELVLLAIAANDKLTEKYKKTLFNQERDKDFDQLLIGAGGQEYIKILSEQLTTSLNRNVMAYGRVFNVLEAASFTQNTECVNAVLKLLRDIKPNNRENVGSTPLHFAVQFNDLEIIKILLDNKFDVNTVDSNGQTPLHFAVQRGSLEIVTLLVEKGAIVTEEIVRLANKQLKPVGDQEGDARKIANFLIDKYTASNMEAPTQEPTENNNSNKFLTNNREVSKMGKNKKSGLNNKYSNGRKSTSGNGVRTKSKKEKIVIQVTGIPVEPNATANGQINTSHAQPIDPEILKLVHNMVETVSDDQTTVGQPEDPSSGKGAGAADDNNNGPNSRVITFENGDEAVIEDVVEEENSGNVSTLESDSDQQDPQPKILVIDDKPYNADGEGNDTPDNGEPDKTSKNAQKSKFPTIAVSTLLTTAVATETAALAMYFAFQASLALLHS